MAKVVAVHGIGQQFKGDAIIHKEWWPALQSGLHLAGANLVEESELVCPFYGHLFRREGALSTSVTYQLKDVDPEEALLLGLLWEAASQTEPERVPSPADYKVEESLARYPQFVQRALNALSKSKFFVNVAQSLMVGDMKQVISYMGDQEVHQAVLNTVLNSITDDTHVVIGHSLGSVVAYEALCYKPNNVVSFITLGSPLGIKNLIFDKLNPPPTAGKGAWPGKVDYWTNIADAGDIVALQRQLAPLFGDQVKDIQVDNGSDAHHGERYLTTREAGEAIKLGL